MKALNDCNQVLFDKALDILRMLGHTDTPAAWLLELPAETPMSDVRAVSDEEWQRAFAFGALLTVLHTVPAEQLKAAIRREMPAP